tara:strand:+ start:312 stop:800 length:489 start_codon:yes stop_codon:yes gene_type:complete
MSSLLGGYSNLSAVKGSPKLGTINFWSASLATHSKKRKKLAKKLTNVTKAVKNQEPVGKGRNIKSILSNTSKVASSGDKKPVVSENVTSKKSATSTQKQDKLFGGKGWGLTEKAQKKLPKILQKIGVGQTEKTVTIMGKKFTFKAPDPRKKRKAWHGGWVYD